MPNIRRTGVLNKSGRREIEEHNNDKDNNGLRKTETRRKKEK